MSVVMHLDKMSRAVQFIAVDAATAIYAARATLRWAARYGLPKWMISDGGSHFKNEVLEALAEALEHLAARLEFMARASLTDIANTIDELFGERIGREQRAILMERYDRRDWAAPVLSAARTGGIYAPAVVAAPERLREVPRHNFHPFILGAPADGPDED